MPAAPSNLSFETAGPLAGQADRWVHRSNILPSLVAGFARNTFLGGGLSRPMELNHADWTAVQLTVAANVEDSPDGAALTAERLTDNGVNTLHYLERTAGIALQNGKAYTFGFFARRGGGGGGLDKVGMYLDLGGAGGGYAYSCFDIFGGGETNRVANLHIEASATAITKLHGEVSQFVLPGVDNVWCLCSTTFLVSGTPSLKPAIILNPPTAGVLATYAGTGSHVDVWGAFLVEGGLDAEDSFEHTWANDTYLFELALGVSAIPFVLPTLPYPDTKSIEDFEELWANTPFLLTLGSVVAASFDTVDEDYEDFEEDWANVPYLLVLSGPTAATFDIAFPENHDDFEEEWGGGIEKNNATTANAGTDELQYTGFNAPFFEGQQVKFITSGTLPAPLVPDTEYFVTGVSGAFYKVASALGESFIDLTTTGTGSHFVFYTVPSPGPTFTVDTGTDELILGFGHGISNGEVLVLGTTLLLPTGLTTANLYVVGATSTRIQLSLSFGGAAINIIDSGTGTHYLLRGLATFDGAGGAPLVEDFEEVVLDKIFTVDAATDTFTSNGHGLVNNDTGYIVPPAGGAFPTPLNPTVRYFVIASAANTFQLSLTQGGAAINITDAGIGIQRFRGDPARYWNETGFNATL
jgi:hypothetical protein